MRVVYDTRECPTAKTSLFEVLCSYFILQLVVICKNTEALVVTCAKYFTPQKMMH